MEVTNRVDPHIHFFDLKGTPRPMQPLGKMFGWNDKVLRFMATKLMPKATIGFFGTETDLIGDYLTTNYRSDTASSSIQDYVHIEAGWEGDEPLDAVGETTWLATMSDGPAAIVAHADLSLGDKVAPVLKAHLAASDRVRGIRDILAWHPSASVMDFTEDGERSRSAAFRAGFDQLAEHNLSYDAWCYSDQLDQIAELAGHNPDVPMVLCHVGTPIGFGGAFGDVGTTPQERDRIAAAWRDGVSAVAAHDHVRCKLSGLLMPVLGWGYEDAPAPSVAELVDKLSPMVEHCLDAFGPERCMYASNFPVDRVAASYETVFNAFDEMTKGAGEAGQQAIFADTAHNFYRL